MLYGGDLACGCNSCGFKYFLRSDMRFVVAGNGKSGRSAYEYLKRKEYDVSFLSQIDLDTKVFEKEYLDRLFVLCTPDEEL